METESLAMLIELCVSSRDAAAVKRAQSVQALEQARHQLQALDGYMREYARRAQSTMASGFDMAAQNNLRAFTARLQQAVDAQKLEVARREAALTVADDELQQYQRKLKSLQTLDARRREAERRDGARREQKSQDEMAQSARERPVAPGW